MVFTDVVLGVDLSLTGLGLVAVPVSWDLRWGQVARCSLGLNLPAGASPREHMLRRRALCDDVARWASRRSVTHVWFEGYPMGGRLFNIDKLAELGGVLKDRFADLGLYPESVPEVTARKLFLGHLPQRDRKAVVAETLRQIGADFDDKDQADAFVVANYGLSELGAPFLAIVPPEKQSAPRARRRSG